MDGTEDMVNWFAVNDAAPHELERVTEYNPAWDDWRLAIFRELDVCDTIGTPAKYHW